MRKVLEVCPSCESSIIVTEISCTQCPTTVKGHFRPTVFAQLSDENLRFVEIFVKNRGNIKDMERELRLLLDPETIDKKAKADQAEIVRKFGGRVKAFATGAKGATRAPGKENE